MKKYLLLSMFIVLTAIGASCDGKTNANENENDNLSISETENTNEDSANTYNTVTNADIIARRAELLEIRENGETTISNDIFGRYDKNDRILVEKYFCSDVCPQYGSKYIIYQGIEQAECEEVGGSIIKDIAWGGYIGCAPMVEE